MLNCGGAIQSVDFDGKENSVRVKVRGGGEMRVFASKKPRACLLDGEEIQFTYEEEMVVIGAPWPGSSNVSVIDYLF